MPITIEITFEDESQASKALAYIASLKNHDTPPLEEGGPEMDDRDEKIHQLTSAGITPDNAAYILGINRATVYRRLAKLRDSGQLSLSRDDTQNIRISRD